MIDYKSYLEVELGKPKLGDYILLRERGIWEITHIDKKDNKIWCGGLKLDNTLCDNQFIIPKSKIDQLKEIEVNFKKGDYVEGVGMDGILGKGTVVEVFYFDIEYPIWIIGDVDGYSRMLKRNSVKHSTQKHTFLGWLKKFS